MRPICEQSLYDLAWHIARFPREQRQAEIERVVALTEIADRYRKRFCRLWVEPELRRPLDGNLSATLLALFSRHGCPEVSRKLHNPDWTDALLRVYAWAHERAERQAAARNAESRRAAA